MTIEKTLDEILNTKSKVRILRLFFSRTSDFMASGREIAKLIGVSPPAVHAALKDLHNQDILKLDIVGIQHIYRLNFSSRIVKEMLEPVFKKESAINEDVTAFLRDKISEYKVRNIVLSLMLYGSLQGGRTRQGSDCDIAIVAKDKSSKERLEELFIDKISGEFSKYFGIHLDAYIKTKSEFIEKLKRNMPPVSTLMNSYTVICGKDPKGLK